MFLLQYVNGLSCWSDSCTMNRPWSVTLWSYAFQSCICTCCSAKKYKLNCCIKWISLVTSVVQAEPGQTCLLIQLKISFSQRLHDLLWPTVATKLWSRLDDPFQGRLYHLLINVSYIKSYEASGCKKSLARLVGKCA